MVDNGARDSPFGKIFGNRKIIFQMGGGVGLAVSGSASVTDDRRFLCALFMGEFACCGEIVLQTSAVFTEMAFWISFIAIHAK